MRKIRNYLNLLTSAIFSVGLRIPSLIKVPYLEKLSSTTTSGISSKISFDKLFLTLKASIGVSVYIRKVHDKNADRN